MEILDSFGFKWSKFLAQILIFLIVYMILKAKAFGPILAILKERKDRIAEGEANLEKIKSDLENAEKKSAELIADADKEAERLITEAKEGAEVAAEKIRQDATGEAGQIIAKAKEASELEHEKALAELKRDFGRLVLDTTSKVTGKVLDDEDQKRINEETAAQVSL